MDIEKLEQRFEMGWIPKFKNGELKYGDSGSWDGLEDKKWLSYV